jgi:hypothetical protein
MKLAAFTGRALSNRNSQTHSLFTPARGADRPSQLSAWSLKTVVIRLALFIFLVLPVLLMAGTVVMMVGGIIGGGTGALVGGILGVLAGVAAFFLGSRG